MPHMANPTGIGGVRFQPGVSGNPSGRSRAQQMGMSSVQLHALKFCIEAVELIAGIMRSSTGDKADSVRLTAAKAAPFRNCKEALFVYGKHLNGGCYPRRIKSATDKCTSRLSKADVDQRMTFIPHRTSFPLIGLNISFRADQKAVW
jgi:hypothetical protein